MSSTVQLKRSALSGKVPGTGSLNLGELALNTYDGKIFFRRSGSTDTVQEVITTNVINTGSVTITGTLTAESIRTNLTGSFGSLKVNDTLTVNHGETIISGSALVTTDLTILGQVNARQFNISIISSSVLFESGSSKFGNTSDDIHSFTGSLQVSGSQSINGNLYLTGSLIPSGNFVYDLGSSTNGFGDVYLSSSTVYMNNNAIFGTTDVVPVNVGDYLQGGIVYYVDTVNGFSYIVNKDDIGQVASSNFTRVGSANSSVLGGGITNTNAITASTGGQQNPAKLCSDFSGSGYTDWYLPSTAELGRIATNTNLMADSLAGVRYNRYWSSTADSNVSKTYYAGDASHNDNTGYYSVPDNNTSVGYVKAVRRTNITEIIRTLSFPNFNFSGSLNVAGTIDGIAIGAFVTQSNERLTNLESSSINLNIVSSSLNNYTASANAWSGTIDSRLTTLTNLTSSYTTTGSNVFSGSQTITGSVTATSFVGDGSGLTALSVDLGSAQLNDVDGNNIPPRSFAELFLACVDAEIVDLDFGI